MTCVHFDSDIRLKNNDSISLILDGSVPGLVLYPVQNGSGDIVDSIKETLTSKGFYTKSFSHNECDFSKMKDFVSENPLLVVILDGLNPNIVFAYGYFKANKRFIFPIYNNKDIKNGNRHEELFEFDDYVSFDLGNTSPEELNTGLKNVLNQYLDDNTETIISDYADIIVLETEIEKNELKSEVRNLMIKIIRFQMGLEKPELQTLNNIYNRIQDLETEHGVIFPKKIYSLLPFSYLSLFRMGVLSTLELKKSIKNINKLSEKLYSTVGNNIDIFLLKKRLADAQTLAAVYDDRIGNCRISIDYLQQLTEKFKSQQISLYKSKVLNNLGINHLLIYESAADTKDLDSAICYFEDAVKDSGREQFPLEFGKFQRNLGICYQRKAALTGDHDLYQKSIDCFRVCKDIYTEDIFPEHYFDSTILIGNSLRDLGQMIDNSEYLDESFDFYKQASEYFEVDDHPYDHSRILKEKARAYRIMYDLTGDDNYFSGSEESYSSSLNYFNIADYPFHYATIISELADLYFKLGCTNNDPIILDKSLSLLEEAHTIITFEENPSAYADIQARLGECYTELASINHEDESYLRAQESYEQVLRVYTRDISPREFLKFKLKLAKAFKNLAGSIGNREYFIKAVESYKDCIDLLDEAEDQSLLISIYNQIGDLYSSLAEINHDEMTFKSMLESFNRALELIDKDRNSEEYLKTMNNIGLAYSNLGRIRSEGELLRDGIRSFNEAIDICSEEKFKQYYAILNYNLAESLHTLYGLSGDGEVLENAIRHFAQSLKIYDFQNFPDQYGLICKKLGICLRTEFLMNDTNDLDKFDKAISYFENSLKYFTSERSPGEYGEISRSIADLFAFVSRDSFETEKIKRSIDYYRNSLQIIDAVQYPLEHALVLNNIGNQFRELAEIEKKAENSNLAIGELTRAAELAEDDRDSLKYKTVINNLAAGYITLADASNTIENANVAIKYLKEVLVGLDKNEYPELYSSANNNMGNALLLLSSRIVVEDDSLIENFKSALQVFDREEYPYEYASILNNTAFAYCCFTDESTYIENHKKAIGMYADAIEIYSSEPQGRSLLIIRNNLANAYTELAEKERCEDNCLEAVKYLDICLGDANGNSGYFGSVLNNNLGTVYQILSKETDGDENRSKTIEYYSKAKSLSRKEEDTDLFSIINGNYATALKYFASLDGETRRIEEELNSYNYALDYYTERDFPSEYASIKYEIGVLLQEYAYASEDPERLVESINSLNDSARVLTRSSAPLYYATVCYALGASYTALSKDRGLDENCNLAMDYTVESENIFNPGNYPQQYAICRLQEAEIHKIISKNSGSRDNLVKTLECYRDSLNYFTSDDFPEQHRTISSNIHDIFRSMSETGMSIDDPEESINSLTRLKEVFSKREFPQEYLLIQKEIAGRFEELAKIKDRDQNTKSAIESYSEIKELPHVKENKLETAEVHKKLGECFYILGEMNNDPGYLHKAVDSFSGSIEFYKDAGNNDEVVKLSGKKGYCLNLIFDIGSAHNDFDGSLTELEKAIDIFKDIQEIKTLNELNYKKARLLYFQANDSNQADKYLEAAKILDSLLDAEIYENSIYNICELHENLGDIYRGLSLISERAQNLKRSSHHYIKALEYSTTGESEDKTFELNKKTGEINRTIGDELYNKEDFESAIPYYMNSVKYLDSQIYPEIYGEIKRKLVDSYRHLGSLQVEVDTDSAIELYKSALEISEEAGDAEKTAEIRKDLADMYMLEGNSIKNPDYLKIAIDNYNNCMDYYSAEQRNEEYSNINISISECYRLLSEIEEAEDNLKNSINPLENALTYLNEDSSPEKFHEISSSITNVYTSLGDTALGREDDDSALDYYLKAIKRCSPVSSAKLYSYLNYKTGFLIFDNDMETVEKAESARLHFLESLKYYSSDDHRDKYVNLRSALGDIESKLYDLTSARKHLFNAIHEYDEVIDKTAIENASRIIDNFRTILLTAADYSISEGNYSDAIGQLTKYLELTTNGDDNDKIADVRKKIGDLSFSLYRDKGDDSFLTTAEESYKNLLELDSPEGNTLRRAGLYKGLFLVCLEYFKSDKNEYARTDEILNYADEALSIYSNEDGYNEINEIKQELYGLKDLLSTNSGNDPNEQVNTLLRLRDLAASYFDAELSRSFNFEIAGICYKQAESTNDIDFYQRALEYFLKFSENRHVTSEDPEYSSYNFKLFNIYRKLYENTSDPDNGEKALKHYRLFKDSGHNNEENNTGNIDDDIYRICLAVADEAVDKGDFGKAAGLLEEVKGLLADEFVSSPAYTVKLAYTKTKFATEYDADEIRGTIDYCTGLLNRNILDEKNKTAVSMDLGDLFYCSFNNTGNEDNLRKSLGYYKDAYIYYSGEGPEEHKKEVEEKIRIVKDKLAELGSFEDTESALEYHLKQLSEISREQEPFKAAELYETLGDIYVQLFDENNSDVSNLVSSIEYYNKGSEIIKELKPEVQPQTDKKIRDSYLLQLGITGLEDYETRLQILEKIHSLGPMNDTQKYSNTCKEAGDLLFKTGKDLSDNSYLAGSFGYYSEVIANAISDAETEESARIKLNMGQICLSLDNNSDKRKILKDCLNYLDDSREYYQSAGADDKLDEILGLKADITLQLAAIADEPGDKLRIFEDFLSDVAIINNGSSALIGIKAAEIYHCSYEAEGETEHLERSVELYEYIEEFYKREGDEHKCRDIRDKINNIVRSSLSVSPDDDTNTKIAKLDELLSIFRSEQNYDYYLKTGLQLASIYMDCGIKNDNTDKLEKSLSVLEGLMEERQIDHASTEFMEVKKKAAGIYKYLSADTDNQLLLKSMTLYRDVIDLAEEYKLDIDLSQLKSEIKAELHTLLRLDLQNEGLSKACSAFWENIDLLGENFSTGEINEIHCKAAEIVLERYEDEEIKTALVFIEKIKSSLKNHENTEFLKTLTDMLLNTHIKSASISYDAGDYYDAVQHYTKAKGLIDNENDQNDQTRSLEVLYGLGTVYEAIWRKDGKYKNLNRAIKNFENCAHHDHTGDSEKTGLAADKLHELKLHKAVLLEESAKHDESLNIFNDLIKEADRDSGPHKYFELLRSIADVKFNILKDKTENPDPESINEIVELYNETAGYYKGDEFTEEFSDIQKKLDILHSMTLREPADAEYEVIELISEADVKQVEQDVDKDAEPLNEPVEEPDHIEMISNYEKILKKLKVEDSPVNYADTCWKIARSYHKLAKETGDKKKYTAALKSYQNALKNFDFVDYPEKNGVINREIGDIFKLQAYQNNDIKLYKQMINYYDDSLKYYKSRDFPEDYAYITRDIAYAQTRIAELSGDVNSYRESAENYRNVLNFFKRESHPGDYADINMRLGISSSIISGFESGNEKLGDAIEAFNNSLEIYNSGEYSDKVALITKYLGIAYSSLADKENEPDYLSKSAENYKMSAELYETNDNLNEFGFVSKSLGGVYSRLAERENRRDNLKNSINAYEDSLTFYTLDISPLEFSSINNHLGSLYRKLSDIEDVSANCARSVECFEQVLRVYNRNDNPMEYAATLNNLGVAYRTLADAENKVHNCKRAIDSYKKALLIYTFKDFPIQYASTQNNIGSAYGTLAEEENKVENCKKAIKAYQEALKVRTIHEMPVQFAATQNNLGVAYRTLSEEEDKARNCLMAIKSYEGSLVVYSLEKFPIQYATTQNNIAGAYSTLAEVEERKKNCDLAIQCYRESQKVFSIDRYAEIYEMIDDSINYLSNFREKEKA